MISQKFLMGRGREQLSSEERDAIEYSVAEVRILPSRTPIVRADTRVHVSALLIEGFAARYVHSYSGQQQMTGLHLPGDFVDLHSVQLKRLDHDIVTIGAAKVAIYDHRELIKIGEKFPRLADRFWFSTLLDGAIHRQWTFQLGRSGSEKRIAHLFCELYTRLEMVGLTIDGTFALPLTQQDLAEAAGLTAVHVNRVLRDLREGAILAVKSKTAHVLDFTKLAKIAEFDPAYLYRSS